MDQCHDLRTQLSFLVGQVGVDQAVVADQFFHQTGFGWIHEDIHLVEVIDQIVFIEVGIDRTFVAWIG